MSAVTLADLAPVPIWVSWRPEIRPGSGRVTKVPKNPRTLRDAASTRPEDWGTRAEAEAAYRRLPLCTHGAGGIGLILGTSGDGYIIVGVDLDSCRDPNTGTLAPWAQEVLALLNTYTELSPSELGVKAFFRVPPSVVDDLRKAGLLEASGLGRAFKRHTGSDHPPAIEVHLGGRYYTVTDQRLPDSPAELRLVSVEVVKKLLGEIGPRFAQHGGGKSKTDRSARAFRLALKMRAGGKSPADFEAALDSDPETASWKLEKGLANDKRELRRAWDRAQGRWETPDLTFVTEDTTPAVPFPLECFPGTWQEWIPQAARLTGSPHDFIAAALLSVIGATIGNARWGSPWQGWAHPPVINSALIGLPSSAKSPGMDVVVRPLTDLELDLNSDWVERCLQHSTDCQSAKECRAVWENELRAAVKGNQPAPPMPPEAREPDHLRRRRVVSTDPTVQAARDLSAANQRGLLLYADELSGWLANMGRYGTSKMAGDRSFWLQAYEGRAWISDRVKDGDDGPRIPHLTWGILGGFQPDRLASALLEGDDDGLAARFIYFWPSAALDVSPRPDGTPLPFELKPLLHRLRDLPMPEDKPVILQFDEDAAALLQEWRHEVKSMEADAAGLFLSWVGKLPGMAVRLAVIFAHLTWCVAPDVTPPPDRVTEDDLDRAVCFLHDYAVPMAQRAFGEAALPEPERDARVLLRWYLRQPHPRPEVLNARVLRRMAKGPAIAGPERINAALEELFELGLVVPTPSRSGGHGGRQRSDWTVNPILRDAES